MRNKREKVTMAKATKTVPQEKLLANPQGKTVEELKEVAITLQAQANQYREMAVKAQGALEMILQMIPKEEVEKMIVQENNDNGEAVDDAETVN
jgi:hypothetical protein